MDIEITFPGGMAVDAAFKGFAVHTDQPKAAGGDGTAPSPFDLFLCSIGTCAGIYALRFCQERNIATAGLAVGLDLQRDPEGKRVVRIVTRVTLPEGFPEKYRDALVRTVNGCTVKRHIVEPPEFVLELGS